MLATCLLVALTMNSYGRAEALVPRLGAASYAAREQVGRELVQLGRHALPALRRGQSHKDPEIAERCMRLIPLAVAESSRKRMAHLESLLVGHPSAPIPWDEILLGRFLRVSGDSPAARELYLEIYKSHGQMLDAVESSDAREAGRAFWAYVDRTLIYPDGRTTVDLSKLTFNRADLAAFWFLSADPDIWPAESRGLERPDCPYNTPRHAEGHLAGPDSTPEMRRLFVAWLAGPRNVANASADDKMLATGLGLGLAAGLREVRPIALRTALDAKLSRFTRATALLTLQQVGTAEDVDRLTAVIQDDTVVFEPSPTRQPEAKVVIGDLALAASVRLSGRELSDFGFAFAQKAPADRVDVSPYIFANGEQRSAARKKWTEWAAAQTARGKR